MTTVIEMHIDDNVKADFIANEFDARVLKDAILRSVGEIKPAGMTSVSLSKAEDGVTTLTLTTKNSIIGSDSYDRGRVTGYAEALKKHTPLNFEYNLKVYENRSNDYLVMEHYHKFTFKYPGHLAIFLNSFGKVQDPQVRLVSKAAQFTASQETDVVKQVG